MTETAIVTFRTLPVGFQLSTISWSSLSTLFLWRGGTRQTSPTLCGRNAQVVYELQVQEEMEGVRQEVREVDMNMRMG